MTHLAALIAHSFVTDRQTDRQTPDHRQLIYPALCICAAYTSFGKN